MTKETKTIFRGKKSFDIISSICKLYNVSIEKAMDIFYQSETSVLIEEGVADLHCRSERYLAQCVWDEYCESNDESNDVTHS